MESSIVQCKGGGWISVMQLYCTYIFVAVEKHVLGAAMRVPEVRPIWNALQNFVSS